MAALLPARDFEMVGCEGERVNSFFSPSAQPKAVTRSKTFEHRGAVCPTALSDMTCVEQELDDAIRELGAKAVQALQDQDPQGARILTNRMYSAIASRTPEHQARLAAEVERRIDGGSEWACEIA